MNISSTECPNSRSDQERRKTQAPEILRSGLLETKVKSLEDQLSKAQKENEEKFCEIQRALQDQKRIVAVIQQQTVTRGRSIQAPWTSSRDESPNTQPKRAASPDLTSNKRTRVDSYIPPRLLSTQGSDRYTPTYSNTSNPAPAPPTGPRDPGVGPSEGVSTGRPALDISLRQAFARAQRMGT